MVHVTALPGVRHLGHHTRTARSQHTVSECGIYVNLQHGISTIWHYKTDINLESYKQPHALIVPSIMTFRINNPRLSTPGRQIGSSMKAGYSDLIFLTDNQNREFSKFMTE